MNKFIRHLLTATVVSLLIFLFILILNVLNGASINDRWVKEGLLLNFGYAMPLYFISAYTFEYVRLLTERNQWGKWKGILYAFPIVALLNIISIIGIQYLIYSYYLNEEYFKLDVWSTIKFPLYISLTIGTTFYIVNFLFRYLNEHKNIQEEKLLNEQKSHDALRMQIGPHFLFNSLNVLSGLVEENPDKAQDFIADLSQIYRYILDQKDKDWVLLSEEIEFSENYLSLLNTRFEQGLHVTIHPELKNTNYLIASLSLQLLLENCIKHNGISKEKPLNISITLEKKHLVVKNNINEKHVYSKREGTGLKNIKERYNFIDKEVIIKQNNEEFTVKIPLLTEGETL